MTPSSGNAAAISAASVSWMAWSASVTMRRLSRARAADDGDELPRVDRRRYAVEGALAGEDLAEVIERDDGRDRPFTGRAGTD
jgi:hypothetical protein